MMEVWKGPFTPRNAKAVKWWHTLLCAGRRIPIVGGSDFHKPGALVRLGHPVTAVYADSPDACDLLAAVRAGHAYVTESVKGPRLELTYGDASMGDVTAYDPSIPVTVKTDASRVTFVTARGEQTVRPVNGEARFSEENARFVYAKTEAALFPGRLLAISNPIYFKEET